MFNPKKPTVNIENAIGNPTAIIKITDIKPKIQINIFIKYFAY